jgi:hypothetical protein
MRIALLILLSALSAHGQATLTLEAESPVSTNFSRPTSWQLQEQSGVLWTNRGVIPVQTSTATNSIGQLQISNVVAGTHAFRAFARVGVAVGSNSPVVITNLVIPYLVVDVQVATAADGPWTNYATITPPPLPGRDLSSAFVRGVLRIQK